MTGLSGPDPEDAGVVADVQGTRCGHAPRTTAEPSEEIDDAVSAATFSALLEDDVEDLYENAPCGYLSTLLDGQIAKVNATLLDWLGYSREQVVGRMRFSDLLTVGGKLYHETHFAPLLRMQGEVNGIALEFKAADGRRLPVLVTSKVKTSEAGEPQLIRTTVVDARDRRAYENELLERRREAERDRHRIQRVLATLQRSLLPPSLPRTPDMDSAAHYHTASPEHLGGDFYDLFALGDGRWAFFLGDVCGKGPEAAAVTSLTRYTLRAAAIHAADPVTVLRTLNTALLQHYVGDDPRYCTAIFGVLTPHETGMTLRMAGGGHPPPLLLGADGTATYVPTPGGMLVGIVPTAHFTEVTRELMPGDTLMLYTDGLTEARRGPDRARYGDEALLAFAAGLVPTSADKAVAAVADLLNGFGDGLDDDTAVLAIGVPSRPDTPRADTPRAGAAADGDLAPDAGPHPDGIHSLDRTPDPEELT